MRAMFSRRSFLATAPLVLTRAAAPPKRNVLFIAIDDLNDWVGCLGGYPGVQTPNLDQLAKQGVLFRSAHCAAPLCNPARAAILAACESGSGPSSGRSAGFERGDQMGASWA